MSIPSPNLAPALGPSGSETPPAAVALMLSPASGTRGGPASSLQRVSGAGRHRRDAGKGLWQENFIAQRVPASHRRVSFPGALADLATGWLQKAPNSPFKAAPCSPSHPITQKTVLSYKLIAPPPAPPLPIKPLDNTIHITQFTEDAGKRYLLSHRTLFFIMAL